MNSFELLFQHNFEEERLIFLMIFFYESVCGLKIVQNLLNTFQPTLFRTSACRKTQRQPPWIWKESLATALLIDIDLIMAGLAYVQHSASENCLQRAVFAAYAHC